MCAKIKVKKTNKQKTCQRIGVEPDTTEIQNRFCILEKTDLMSYTES